MARGHCPRWAQRLWAGSIAAGMLAGFTLAGAKTNASSTATNPSRPPQTTNALDAFVVAPGFRFELVAQAPQVEAPVALAFDENGRLFVAEMRDFPNRMRETPHLGRIRLLEDTNGSGKFESSTVFADDLPCPSAIACYDGGLFVAAGPDILYLKDSSGTGHADVRRVVFTGFGVSNTPDADAFLNNFNWGLDNRIHVATGGVGGIVSVTNAPGSGAISLAGSDFSFDPRSLTLQAEAGPAQSALCFDDNGRLFISDYTRALRVAMASRADLARNPFFPYPPEFLDLLSPATAIFRFVSPEPALVVASKAGGTNPPSRLSASHLPVLAPAWLTHACGTVVYRGSAFPSNYLENVFIAEPAAHIIHRAVLHENGLEPTATRAPGEARTEFVASSDPSFHPLQLVNGPDGLLYVADFRGGQGSGRLYRIVPERYKRPPPPHLGAANPRELVSALADPNGWRRDTAARLLYQRPNPAVVPLLGDMLAYSKLPLARLHALCALVGLASLTEPHLLRALQDPDYRVRERAVLLCQFPARKGLIAPALWTQLSARATDPSVRVRYQLAFTLGEVAGPVRIPGLASILLSSEDRWLRAAVLSSLGGHEAEMLLQLGLEPRFGRPDAEARLLERLADMVGVEGQEKEVNAVLDALVQQSANPGPALPLLAAVGEGLHRTRSSLALVDPQNRLEPFYTAAQSLATSPAAALALRIQAIRLLSVSPLSFSDVGDLLLLSLGSAESPAIQSAVLAALARYDDPRIARAVLARWPRLPASLHDQAAATLLAWTNRVPEVLSALEQEVLHPSDLSAPEQSYLRTYPEPQVRTRAAQVLGALKLHRPEVVHRFEGALRLKGFAGRGIGIFRARCASCHELGGVGHPLGPDLVAAKVAGRESLLLAVLEPNAHRRPGYSVSALRTQAGEVSFGLVRDENLRTLTLGQPNGVRTVWPRETIETRRDLTCSLMPDGLEQGLTTQDLADLLDFIMTSSESPVTAW